MVVLVANLNSYMIKLEQKKSKQKFFFGGGIKIKSHHIVDRQKYNSLKNQN